MSPEPAPDPRTDPPPRAGGRATLAAFLTNHRETLRMTCDGLDAEALARRVVPHSTLSLLGLVRHLADVERAWFRRVLSGRDAPPIFYTTDAPHNGHADLLRQGIDGVAGE